MMVILIVIRALGTVSKNFNHCLVKTSDNLNLRTVPTNSKVFLPQFMIIQET